MDSPFLDVILEKKMAVVNKRGMVGIMINDQIPMTNEKDNDQFINNQLDKGKGATDCLHRFFW